jgi:hypothetical protein
MFKLHGHTTHTGSSPTYKSWHMMKQRCCNPNNAQYHDYGGRGITMCSRWMSFENFLADMGERPDGTSIERKDNNIGYYPDNCCWATKSAQQRNRRANRYLELDGRRMILVDWAAELDITPHALIGRLNRGWTMQAALTTPAANRGRRKKMGGT